MSNVSEQIMVRLRLVKLATPRLKGPPVQGRLLMKPVLLLMVVGMLVLGAVGPPAYGPSAGCGAHMPATEPAFTKADGSHLDCRYGPALGWKSYWHRHPPGDPLHTRPLGCTGKATARKPNVP